MKNIKIKYTIIRIFALCIALIFASCSRDFEDLELAKFPNDPLIFIDGFSGGLEYVAFGGSKVDAFSVDTDDTYKGEASMRFAVPRLNDPSGAYAGGTFIVDGGRDLTEYDALTFWAKASKSARLDLIGFGNDLDQSPFQSTISDVPLNTNWRKFYIPIADASKLTAEEGMLFFSEAPEEEKGYTFWIDEVQFEKLGTLARPKSAILENQNITVSAETGDSVPITGTYVSFNLPTGVDQRVDIGKAFFDFTSSAPSVASVNSRGDISIIDSGTAVITAKLDGEDAGGSITIESSGQAVSPTTSAPTPTVSQDSVISMFSNAYNDVTVDTWNPFWEFSTAEVLDIKVGEDDVKRYSNLNFVGILTESEPIDASQMTHFHIDIWTPNLTDPPASFKVLLADFGADSNFGGGDDSSFELSFTSPLLQTEEWVSIDIPLSDFTGLTSRSKLAQLVLSGDLSTVFVDNVYFYNSGEETSGGSPSVAAPSPDRPEANVISIYSDTYTNVDGTNLNPDWGQATSVSELTIDGNKTLLYAGLNYQGTEFGSSLDVSGMTHLHIDYWTENSSTLSWFLISDGPVETPSSLEVPTQGWKSVDIPLSDFSPVDLANLIQYKFEGNGNIFLDNIYFYSGGDAPTEPQSAAPDPTRSEADVISIFSDSYTNLDGSNLNPDWGQATATSEFMIEGNNTLRMLGLNYQGIELAGSQDVSEMTHLHIDFWSANSDALSIYTISSGPVETPVVLSVPTNGWASMDIPLTSFAPVDFADLSQFKFEGNGDIYIDNLYFYKEGEVVETEPGIAAPEPSRDQENVLSIFSDTYTNLDGINLNPDWGQATATSEISIEGNNTLQMLGLNFQGIELGSNQDVSGMTHLHLNVWTANSEELKVFLISPGPSESAVSITVPTEGWSTLEIPLSDFSAVALNEVFQFKFEGNGDIFFDNIYFYK